MSRRGRDGESFGIGALKTGAIVSAVAGAYKFGEFVLKLRHLHGVDGMNSVFVRIVDRVRTDLEEVERLLKLKEVKEALKDNPKKVAWIYNCIGSMRQVLESTNKICGGVTAGLSSWTWGLYSRAKWVLEDHEKVQHLRMEIAVNHLSVLNVLTYLAPLEPLACCKPKQRFEDRRQNYEEAREFYRGIDQRGAETGRYDTEKDKYYIKDYEVHREPESDNREFRAEEDILEVDDRGRGYGDELVVENGHYYQNRSEPYEERDRYVRVEEDIYREKDRQYEERPARRIEMVDYERREEHEDREPRERHKHHRRVAHHHSGGSVETVEKVCDLFDRQSGINKDQYREVDVESEGGAWIRRRGPRL
jgi:hypothetical protein